MPDSRFPSHRTGGFFGPVYSSRGKSGFSMMGNSAKKGSAFLGMGQDIPRNHRANAQPLPRAYRLLFPLITTQKRRKHKTHFRH